MNIYPEPIKQKARSLRSQGWSLGEISQEMRIPKNTLQGWVKNIQLTMEQRKRIKEKEIASAAKARPLALAANREKLERWKGQIREKVQYFQDIFFQSPEIGKIVCGVLYLCEGAKYPSTRCLIFGNSDPYIIRCFLALLRNHFGIQETKLRCRVVGRYDQDICELQQFWSEVTNIPPHHFYKTKADIRTKGKPTQRKDYKGVCMIQYPSTSLQFLLQSIGQVIVKNWS